MNEYIMDVFKNYIKKYVLIENYTEMDDDFFYNNELIEHQFLYQYKNFMLSKNTKYIYSTIIKNNILYLYLNYKENLGQHKRIGFITFSEEDFVMHLPVKYIKRSYYNSLSSIYEESTEKNVILNYQYIEKLPEWIIDKNSKIGLFSSNQKLILNKIKIILEPTNAIIVNKKNFEANLNYFISLYGMGAKMNNMTPTYYISSIVKSSLRKSIDKKISEIYTLKQFGKSFKNLNKKEMTLLNMQNY